MISPHQSTFMMDCLIQENSIVAFEAIHSIKRKRGQGGSMAFYKIEWSLILTSLKFFGFPPLFINWISICLSSASFSILLNGSPHSFFTLSWGLRQGDPFSLFLFIICMESLSKLLLREEAQKNLKGLKLGIHGPPFSHFFLLMTLSFLIKPLLEKLDPFLSWSGQSLHPQKFSILFSPNTSSENTRLSKTFWEFTTPALGLNTWVSPCSLIGKKLILSKTSLPD